MTAVSARELAALPVFADIPERDLAGLAAVLEPLRAAAGEVLMRQGEKADSFAIVASGRVQIRHVGAAGQVATVELAPGTVVGEIALLRHSSRTATVIA
jgi:CRP-like cAMP-binding protein